MIAVWPWIHSPNFKEGCLLGGSVRRPPQLYVGGVLEAELSSDMAFLFTGFLFPLPFLAFYNKDTIYNLNY